MIITGARILWKGRFQKRDIRISDGFISEISEIKKPPAGDGMHLPKISERVYHAEGCFVIPSLTELHSHGCVGEDFSSSDEEGIHKMLRFYASQGILDVMATVMTGPKEAMLFAIRRIRAVVEKQKDSDRNTIGAGVAEARICGIRMEGPFLGADKHGAHDIRYLTGIDEEFLMCCIQEAGHISILDLDPNLEGAAKWLRRNAKSKHPIRISLAHTSADYVTAKAALQAGASQVTHLYNAMNPAGHRSPGLIGAAFDEGVPVELICDGIHVDPSIVRMTFQTFKNRVILISDSMSAAGMGEGCFELGGQQVNVKQKKAVLADGTIAGSCITLLEAMQNAIRFGINPETAVYAVTGLPAKAAGIEEKTGSIEKDRKAKLLILNNEWELKDIFS